MGQTLVVYRRHGIGTMEGFRAAEFLHVPAPAGVGAVNMATVKRDPESNTDLFVNELGLWRFSGGGVEPVGTNCQSMFADSINWGAERYFQAEVYDHRYWLACAFAPSTTNKPAHRI